MATLALSAAGEVHLTLRGADENRVLETLRRWPYWRRADIERDPAHPERFLSVTLVTDKLYEPMVRDILQRSFGLKFPAEGGSSALDPAPAPSPKRRRR